MAKNFEPVASSNKHQGKLESESLSLLISRLSKGGLNSPKASHLVLSSPRLHHSTQCSLRVENQWKQSTHGWIPLSFEGNNDRY